MPVRRRTTSPRTTRQLRRRALMASAAVVVLLGTAAVVGSNTDTGSDVTEASNRALNKSGAKTQSSTPVADSSLEFSTATSGQGIKRDTVQTSAAAPWQAKIIRTGSIDVEVAKGKFDAASARLAAIAASSLGFISASEVSALDGDPHGSITMRIPAARFDETVAQVRKIGEVKSINTGSQDVTGEYTDVASRLKSLESEREQINLVLSRAETIPDILSVRDRLSVVQGEIEQLQGRQKVLDDQTSLSTLTVTMSEQGSPGSVATAPPTNRAGLSGLWHDSAERFTDGGRSIALGLATMAPWLLLGLLLFIPGRAIWRRTAPVATPAD